MDLLEGGIRVPLIARWPGVVPPGTTTAQLAITMDWVATFLAACGVAPDPAHGLDGENLMETLRDPRHVAPRELFWRMKHRDQRAMRSDRWKYFAQDGREYLFDLATDPRERANLAQREPGRFASMRERYAAWESTMPPVPADAKVSLAYAAGDLATPTG
jgi:arylsulfatase A-like enzyme